MALQRHYGNRYVQQAVLQAKLMIGPPGDRYEREADRVAQAVVRGSAGPWTRGVQSVGGAAAGLEPGNALQSRIQEASVAGLGQHIPGPVRAPLEQALGADLSGVRVHHDTQADQLNRSLRANALTTGSDIFFRRGRYAPGSREGDALLTHELVHVLQQRGDPGPVGVVQLHRPEDYSSYAEAKDTNKYSRKLLDKQRTSKLASRVGKPFTPAQRNLIYDVNEEASGGQLTSDADGRNLYRQDTDATPHVDHRFPKSKGGTNSYANAAVLPAKVNIQKSDNLVELSADPDVALPAYQGLVDPPQGVMRGKDFSKEQRDAIYAANMAHYGRGSIVSDDDGATLLAKWDSSEVANVDHIFPRSAGGSSFYFNATVISAQENIQKGGERGNPDPAEFYDYAELQMTLEQYYKFKKTEKIPGGVLSESDETISGEGETSSSDEDRSRRQKKTPKKTKKQKRSQTVTRVPTKKWRSQSTGNVKKKAKK